MVSVLERELGCICFNADAVSSVGCFPTMPLESRRDSEIEFKEQLHHFSAKEITDWIAATKIV